MERCHRSIVPMNVPIKWEGTQRNPLAGNGAHPIQGIIIKYNHFPHVNFNVGNSECPMFDLMEKDICKNHRNIEKNKLIPSGFFLDDDRQFPN